MKKRSRKTKDYMKGWNDCIDFHVNLKSSDGQFYKISEECDDDM